MSFSLAFLRSLMVLRLLLLHCSPFYSSDDVVAVWTGGKMCGIWYL